MSISNQKIVGQLRSLRISLINMIIALRVKEDAARANGDTHEADQLLLRRLQLNDESIRLWQAESAATTGEALSKNITDLEGIAGDARKAAKSIKSVADMLRAATEIITLLKKLGTLVY